MNGLSFLLTLKYVTGDWILVLDADEELNPAIVPKMRRAMEKEENLVINLIRHEIGAVQSPYSLISRLFRRHPQVTFTRPYHSIIDDNVAILLKKEPNWKIVELPEIAIFHYGYTVDKIASLDKFERARKAMDGFYQQHPHDPYVCSKLGGLYLKIGRDKEGFKLLKHGLKCHGSNPHILYELYYHLANYYYSVDEFKKSADHFIKAIEQPILDQLKLGAYNNFGGLLYEAENYETALSIFEKTVEIDPSYADGYYNLGLVLKQLHRLPESIKAYKKALKLNPDNPDIYQNLGVAYIVFGIQDGSLLSFINTNNLGLATKNGKLLLVRIKPFRDPNHPQIEMWSMSADKYLKEALRNLEYDLENAELHLPTKVTTPLSHKYRPEMDVSPLLDEAYTRWYQQLIGILRWAVELGRIDIHLSVALLAQYLAQPRRGHLHQVFHIFAYLKAHSRSRIVLDPSLPMVDEHSFVQADWSEFYVDAKEAIPPNAPEPRGKAIVISCFVDADHAGNLVTRRSHTGILIFCNKAPILWFSKRQNTVETSTFGFEFIAAKIAVEMIEGLRYKLRMFGVPIDGPANVYCDNNSVVTNSARPESTLKKKHNAIAYHKVREAIAQGTIWIAKEPGETNLADILTKPLPGPRMKALIQHILY